MIRYAPIPRIKAEHIDLQHVASVRFVTEGANQYFVVAQTNGHTHNLTPTEAIAFYWQHIDRAGCALKPCYYRKECDHSGDACALCCIGENLEGLGHKARPEPLPPAVEVKPGVWPVVLAGCGCWLAALLLTLILTMLNSNHVHQALPHR